MFDVVISDQVFEHVFDYDLVLGEMRRVLRRGGVGLHIFPSRWRVIEAHVLVPFAGVVRSRAWLSLWAKLGVRNAFQGGKSWREVVELNHDYLMAHTNYLTGGALQRVVTDHFGGVIFAERSLLANKAGRSRQIRALVSRVPGAVQLFSVAHSRCVVFRRPIEQ